MKIQLENYFPKNFTPRDSQKTALQQIERIWGSGKKIAIGILPTGSGKSHIAKTVCYTAKEMPSKLVDMVNNYSIYKCDHEGNFEVAPYFEAETYGSFILTISKQLQDQYQSLFPNEISIKGKSNYECNIDDKFTAQFSHCNIDSEQKKSCFMMNNCSYYKNRNLGLISNASVLNYSVFLNLPKFLQKRQIIVMDEASDLEDELVSSHTLTLLYKNLDFEGIDYEHLHTSKPNKALIWLNEIYSKIEEMYDLTVAKSKEKPLYSINQNIILKINRLNNLLNINRIVMDNWDKYEYIVEKQDEFGASFCPYNVSKIARDIINNAQNILMMSATISNIKEFTKNLGIKNDEYEVFEVKSTFDPKKSPIYFNKNHYLTFKTMDTVLPKVIEDTIKICKNHKNEKGIIHTHTNKILEALKAKVGKDKRFLFRDKENSNEDIIKLHSESSEPTILVSPSMDTGVSLDGDLGRFQIIMKAPYLPLGSNRIKKMFDENKEHYISKMLDTVIQMCGRCTRSEDDYSKTYILDANVLNTITKQIDLLPHHFLERFCFD